MSKSNEMDGGGEPRGSAQPGAVPQAVIVNRARAGGRYFGTRLWWLTAACIVMAIALVLSSLQSQGVTITVRFQDGHGLKPGDTLRFRGIDVGEVRKVQVASALDGVQVEVLLMPGNESIAVDGSQFWIERPRLRIGQVSGLDTVLGAKYVGVLPGKPDAAARYDFEGLDQPLTIARGDAVDVEVHFPTGAGLATGDTVQFRGITVGEVTFVELTESLDGVVVGVRLVGAARSLARSGTQFWIERPRIDLTEIRGLETLVGGRYIAIQPTTVDSEPKTSFTGLAEPPPLPRRDGSLEIELDAANRLGLVRGAPVTFRGLEVGRVSNVDLSNDGATVKIRAVVDAEYAELVRNNSKWWVIGGMKVDASLRGVHVAVDSLAAWVRGGVAFATPEAPGEHVFTGHRFVLEAEPLPEWLEWQPRIAVGEGHAAGHRFPEPVRVVASWKASMLGLYRRRTAECWAIVLDDNHLRVPTSFVEQAREVGDGVVIEVSGQSLPFVYSTVQVDGASARMQLPPAAQAELWPSSRVSDWNKDMVLLIINPELSDPLALDSTRLAVLPDVGLEIASGVPIPETLHGSPVVAAGSGDLVGILSRRGDGWAVASVVAGAVQ